MNILTCCSVTAIPPLLGPLERRSRLRATGQNSCRQPAKVIVAGYTSIAERLKKVRGGDEPSTASVAGVPNGDPSTIAADRHRKTPAAQKPGAVSSPFAGAGDKAALETADLSSPSALEPLPTQPLESQLSALPRAPLMPFDATGRMAAAIPFAFDDYLELVDATGRVIREDKKGYIPGETPRILERLHIDPEPFIATTTRMLQQFSTAIGTPENLTAHCVTRNIAFLRGMSAARALFERKAA